MFSKVTNDGRGTFGPLIREESLNVVRDDDARFVHCLAAIAQRALTRSPKSLISIRRHSQVRARRSRRLAARRGRQRDVTAAGIKIVARKYRRGDFQRAHQEPRIGKMVRRVPKGLDDHALVTEFVTQRLRARHRAIENGQGAPVEASRRASFARYRWPFDRRQAPPRSRRPTRRRVRRSRRSRLLARNSWCRARWTFRRARDDPRQWRDEKVR